MIAGFQRWWYTVRPLRAVQIYGRIWYRIYRPSVDESPAPPLRRFSSVAPDGASRQPSMLGADIFRFLNETHSFREMSGWDDPAVSKLWRYNVHYFDDLNANAAADRTPWHRALINRWLTEVKPGRHSSGWEPYPTSLRIVNWIRWYLAGNDLSMSARQSLAMQVRWLTRRLEHHLLGNHLWANAKALVFAGIAFDGPESVRWLDRGLALLDREIGEQILADAGHFELSPMYHAIILNDLLELIALDLAMPSVLPKEAVLRWRGIVPRMLAWLKTMSHPDGEVALFNDAAHGIAPRAADLEAFAKRLGIAAPPLTNSAMVDLAASGYVRLQKGGAVLIADAAAVGPTYLPGHAHADTLTFELSIGGGRCIVNGGTSRYDTSPERLLQRGTAAHNTVVVNGENSSEVWSSFRVARRAQPFGKRVYDHDDQQILECAHDGYKRLGSACMHHRKWTLEDGRLLVEDWIEGNFGTATARYHLHPSVMVELVEPSSGLLHLPGRRVVQFKTHGARCLIAASRYHSGFNQSLVSQCIEISFETDRCSFELTWPNQ